MLVYVLLLRGQVFKRYGLGYGFCCLGTGKWHRQQGASGDKNTARGTIDMALVSYEIFDWVEVWGSGPTLWSCCAGIVLRRLQTCQFNCVTQSSTRLTIADKWQLSALISNYTITNILLLS